jgi:hypothetical protein
MPTRRIAVEHPQRPAVRAGRVHQRHDEILKEHLSVDALRKPGTTRYRVRARPLHRARKVPCRAGDAVPVQTFSSIHASLMRLNRRPSGSVSYRLGTAKIGQHRKVLVGEGASPSAGRRSIQMQ